MNRITALLVVAGALIVSPWIVAARASVPQQVKVGVVDFEKTMDQTPAGKRANAALKASQAQKQAEFDKHKADFLAQNKTFEQQKSVLAPADLQQKEEELEKAYAELGKLAAQLERDLAAENSKAAQDLMKQAEPIIKQLAISESCTLVVDARELVWVDPALDLTDRLDAQMK
jgi:outer membrane protein